MFLLDTNIVSDLVRNPKGRIAKRIKKAGEDNICTSIVVAAELRFGAEKVGSDRLRDRIDQILSLTTIEAFRPPADHNYAEIRAELERAGSVIGGNDLIIAAQSLALNCVLVTANEKEFSRIAALKIENWLK